MKNITFLLISLNNFFRKSIQGPYNLYGLSKFIDVRRNLFLSFFAGIIILGASNEVKSQSSQTFTSSGSFTVPAGVTSITVECWGGGGKGGARTTNGAGGGGGGGAYSMSTLTVTPGNSYTVTVGLGSTTTSAGGDTYFNNTSTILAKGGNSVADNSATGVAGGLASSGVGTLKYSGGTGANGTSGSYGGGGGSSAGSAANGNNGSTSSGGTAPTGGGAGGGGRTGSQGNGTAGTAPGGGGGGALRTSNSTRTGGSGADGQVVISWVPAYVAQFSAMDFGSANWCPGETRTVSVTVKNIGQATWTNTGTDVNIGVKWNADADYFVRTDANDLAPGETRTYTLNVTAPLTAGSNNLTFDVVKEGDCWFGNNNGSCGPGNTVYTSSAITIYSLPSITSQPANSTKCDGASTTFSVTASGSNLSYQWQENGTILSNSGVYSNVNSATLNISNVTGLGVKQYKCIVSGSCSPSVTSSIATLTVNSLPAITTQPIADSDCPGAASGFSVTATGTAISYQWQADGVNISNSTLYSGVTTSALTISNITGLDGKQYRCIVTGTCSPAATSNTGLLTVYVKPTLSVQPASASVCDGVGTTFSVSASGTSLSYKWQENNVDLSNTGVYSNVTTSALTLSNVNGLNGKIYRCIVSGTCTPAVTSTAATLTVYSVITASISGGTSPICYNTAPGTFTLTRSGGTGTYTYQWYNTSGLISGATTTSYSPGNITFTTGYYCIVNSGSCTPVTTNTITITVYGNLAAGLSGYTSPICYNTSPGTFISTASGATGAYTYQWYISPSTIISGATNSTYTVGNLTANTGYFCKVSSGSCTPISSATTTITVYGNLTAAITGGTSPICYNTSPGTFTATGSGGTGSYTYQWYNTSGLISGATANTYNPGNITTNTGYYCLVSNGTCGTATTSTTSITVYNDLTASISGGTSPICYNTAPGTFTLTRSGGTGSYTYQWYNTSGLITGATTTTYTPAALTSTTGYYCLVTSGTCGTETSNTTTITVYGNLTSTITPGNTSICYNTDPGIFTATPSGGTGTYNYQWYISPSSIISGATESTYDVGNLTSTTGYFCKITSGSCNPISTATTTITVYGNLTASISGGSSPICYNTAPGTFTLTKSGGTGSYTYQWYNTSGLISGATTTSYSPGNITSTTGYYCIVNSGSCTPVTTNTITITVYGNLAAGLSGYTSPICYNTSPGTFISTATGATGAYTYQWYISPSTIISGATKSTYTVGNLTANTGYFCKVSSGSCTSISSATTTITVYGNLTAAITGGTSPICYNTSPGTFTATGSGGTGSYTYQWYNTSGLISGATTNTYNPGNITATTGYYCLVSSGTCGTATTSTTSITVYNDLTASVSGGTSPICYNTAPGTFTLAKSGGTGSYTYQWYNTSGLITGATTTAYTPGNLTATTGYYCLVTSGACGTETTNTITITVNPLPVAYSFAGNNTICSGTSANLSLSGSETGINYQLRNDAGNSFVNTAVAGNGSAISLPTGNLTTTTTFNVLATNNITGCFVEMTGLTVVTVNPSPSVTLSPSDADICLGSISTLTATNSGGTVDQTLSGSSGTLNMTITDASKAAYTYPAIILSGSGGATLNSSDIIQVTLNINHNNDADLDIFLVDPSGTRAMLLSSDNGGSGNNYTNTVLSTAGLTSITSTSAPFTGTYRPEGAITTAPDRSGAVSGDYSAVIPANALNGAPIDGSWSLRVWDDASGTTGTLVNWSLSITKSSDYSNVFSGPATIGSITYSGTNNSTATVNVTPPLGSNLYSVTVTDGLGCTGTANTTVVVDNTNTATISGGNTPICYNTNPGILTTNASGGNGAFSFQWYKTTGIIAGATSSTYNPGNITATTGYYCVVSSGSCSPATTSTKTITVYNNLAVTLNPGNTSICYNTDPGNIVANASGGTGSYTYQWYNTSGIISGATNSSYDPGMMTASTGYYCVVTSGACGTVTSATTTITVYGNLLSGNIGNAQTICYNTVPVQFSFTTPPSGGTGSYTYKWYNSSGIISGATNNTYTPPALTANNSYYCLVTSGSCGTVTTNTVSITVYGNLTANLSGVVSPICYNNDPGIFTVNATGATGSYSYQWYISPSTIIGGATNSTYNVSNLTSTTGYFCKVTSGTCSPISSATTTITVYGNLTAAITGGTSPICYNTSPGTFTATGSGGTGTYTYQWYNASGIIGGATQNTYNPGSLTANNSYYCLITSGSCGTATTSTTSISVYNILSASVSGGNSPICYNTSPGTFTVARSGGTGTYNYQWYNTSGSIAGATLSTYTAGNITASTSYYCLVTSGSCGTVTTNSVSISVYNNLSVSLNTVSASICYNTDPGVLSANASGASGVYSYQWYTSSGSIINGATNSNYDTGNLTASSAYYCVVGSGSCGTVTSATSSITVNPMMSVSVTPSSSSICLGSSSTLNITNSGGTSNMNFAASSGTINKSISDNSNAAYTYPTISLSGSGGATLTASDIIQVTLNITHSNDGDLDIFLVDPSGTRAILLSADNGGSGNNYTSTILSTDAATLISSGSAPFTGTFRPEGTISTAPDRSGAAPYGTGNYNSVVPANSLLGAPIDGAWSLRVWDDYYNGAAGTLVNWSLSITKTIGDYTTVVTGPATIGSVTYSGTNNSTATADVTPPLGTNTYTVTTTDAVGCTATNSTDITVKSVPTITGTTTASRCGSGTLTLGATASAGIINWYSAASGGTSLGTGASFTTPSISTTTTYYVDATFNGCTSSPRTPVVATIYTVPAVTNPSSISICSGNSPYIVLSASVPSHYYWTIGTITGNITGAYNNSGDIIDQALTNPSQTTSGTVQYIITPVSATGSCSGSQYTITVTVKPTPIVVITKNYCGAGGTVQLTSNAFTSYVWSTGATSQSINVNLAGIYTVTATNSFGCSGVNASTVAIELVNNGDFEDGNTGFITAYTNHQGYFITNNFTSGLYPEGLYAVNNDANAYHPNFYGTDHTNPGTGKFMMVNGSPSATPITVWAQNISIQPNTSYYFSAFARSLNNVSPYAQLQFAVNGVQLGTVANLTAGASSDSGPFYWTQFYGTWNSGSTTSATLSIVDINSAAGGNDFALDDISASTLTPINFNVSPSGGGSSVCQGNSFTLSSNVSGIATPFTYSWSGPNNFTSNQANVTLDNATTAMSGNYSLTVTDGYGCPSKGTVNVIVNPVPTVSASVSSSPICYGNSINLTSSANTYASVLYSENFNGVTNLWTTSNSSVGGTTANAAWTLRPSNYSANGITFITPDVTQFYLSSSIAQNGTTTATILKSPLINASGYTSLSLEFYQYYRFGNSESAAVEVSTNGSSWTPVATYTSTQGSASAFLLTTINLDAYAGSAVLYVRFNYNATNDYYWAIDNIRLYGNSSIYNYSWTSNPSGYASSLQNPTGIIPLANTVYTVSYSIPANGCSNVQSTSVLVNPLPSIVTQPVSPSAVCASSGANPVFAVSATGTGPLSYRWQEFRSSWNNLSDAGVYSGTSTSALTINNPPYSMNGYQYRCIVSGGCAPAVTSSAAVLTVKSLSAAPIGVNIANNNTCVGTFKILTPVGGSLGANANWQWYDNINCTPPALYTGVSYTVNPATSTQYWVRAEGECNISSSASNSVTVLYPPDNVVVTPFNPTACQGDNVSFNVTGNTISSYQWQKNGVNLSNQNTNVCLLNNLVAGDFGNYTCVASNSCGSTTSNVSSLSSGAPYIIIQPQTVSSCKNTSAMFSITQWNQNTNSYTLKWYENGVEIQNSGVYSIITNGQNSFLSISNTFGLSGKSYYCVITGNSCSGNPVSSNTVTLNVSDTGFEPAQPGTISGPANVCNQASSVVYSISPVYDAASYTWTVPADAVITSGQGTTAIMVTFGSSSGNIAVTANNICGISSAKILAVNVNTSPIIPGAINVNNNITPCPNTSGVTFSIDPVPGTVNSYHWTLPSGSSIASGIGTNNSTANLGNISGNISVSTVNACGESAAQVTALNFPAVPSQPGSISGSASVCAGDNAAYSVASVPNATGYTWSVPSGASIIYGNNTNNITVSFGTASGNISVTADYACGKSGPQSKTVTVNSSPSKPGNISSNKSVFCAGQSGVTFSIAAVPNTTSYNWNVPVGTIINAGQGSTSITVTLGNNSGNIGVTAINLCGSSQTNSMAVNLISVPDTPGSIAGNSNICSGDQNISFSIASVNGATSYIWSGFPSDASINVPNSNNIIVNFGTVTGNFNINVSAGNSCGFSAANMLPVNVNTKPDKPSAIAGNKTVCSGDNGVVYSISSNSSGAPVVFYNWSLPSGISINSGIGTTSISTDFTTVTNPVAYNISVTADNACGSSAPSVYNINLYPISLITINNTNSLVQAPNTVNFSVSASGANLSYRWYEDQNTGNGYQPLSNGGKYSGCTSSDLYISNTSTALNGYKYYCVVSGTCGSVTSAEGTLTVTPACYAAGINSQPVSAVRCAGSSVTFSVDPTGSDPFTYKWYKNGGLLATATNNDFTISSVTAANAGSYKVVVSNCGGAITSDIVSLTVNSVPAQPGAISGNASVCAGSSSQVFSISPLANASNYIWNVPSDAVITDGDGTNAVTVTFGSESGNISVIPANNCGSGTAQTKSVTVIAAPSSLSGITGSSNICIGDNAKVYSINAVNGATDYIWNAPSGATITSGQHTRSVTVSYSNITGNLGNISVSAGNACGYSDMQTLAVSAAAIPAQPDPIAGLANVCANSTGVVYNVTPVQGANGYNWSIPADASIISGQGTNSIKVNLGGLSGNISVIADNYCGLSSAQSVYVTVTSAPPAQPATISGKASVCSGDEGVVYSITPIPNAAGYVWTLPPGSVITNGQNTPNITVTFDGLSGNIGVSAFNVCGSSGSQTKTISLFNNPAKPGQIYGPVSVCAGDQGAVYFVNNVSGVTGYTWEVPYDATIVNGQNTNSITVNFGTSSDNINVTADNVCSSSPVSSLPVNVNALVSITSNLNNITQMDGTDAHFSISAIGSNISYQWQEDAGFGFVNIINGGKYSGALTNNLLISNVSLSMNAFKYRCIATGTCNSNTSAFALLNVTPFCGAVTIFDQPDNDTKCEGLGTSFNVVASGTAPFKYQWKKNGFDIPGATANIYSISKLSVNDDGNYSVVISNCNNSNYVTSNNAVLTVNSIPVVVYPPSNATVHNNGSLAFNIVVKGNGLNYQWQENRGNGWVNLNNGGVNPAYSGVTTKTLQINDASLSMNGYKYRCIVYSQCYIPLYSVSATLSVITPGLPGLWVGVVNSDWNVGGNWDTGTIPDLNTDVIINNSAIHQPVVLASVNAVCKNITINPRASLSVFGNLHSSANLYIKSDASGTAAFYNSNSAIINIDGNVTIERFMSGKGYHYISTPFYNTTFSQINDDYPLVMNGQYFNPDKTMSPFPNIWMIDESHTHNIPYDYNSWLSPSNLSDNMELMRGYALNIKNNNLTLRITGDANNLGGINHRDSVTYVLSKSAVSTDLIHNNVLIDDWGKTSISGQNHGTGPCNGWHLIGNPYPSPVDWDAVSHLHGIDDGVGSTYSVFMPVTQYVGVYGYYNPLIGPAGAFHPTQYIHPMQSFFLRNTSVNPGTLKLKFKNSMRDVSKDALSSEFYKKSNAKKVQFPILRLSAINQQAKSAFDETVLCFIPDATDTFDSKYDANKLMNNIPDVPNIFTRIKDVNYAINALQSPVDGMVIPLVCKVTVNGKYVIKPIEFSNFDSSVQVFLVDTKDGKMYKIVQDKEFVFDLSVDESESRFYITFSVVSTGTDNNIAKPDVNVCDAFSINKDLFVNYYNSTSAKALLNVYTIEGQLVFTSDNITNGSYKYNLAYVRRGIYLVKIISDNKTYISKIYLE